MIGSLQLGVMFSPLLPIGELPGFADHVDGLGFDQLWLAEDCFAHGGVSSAAVALTRMSRTAVGLGLLPAAMRNPALTAMELATLSHLYPGRLRVAFGHGVEAWMRQIGARPANRVSYLREVADAVARLTRGETVTRHSDIELDEVRLDQAPAQPPEFLVGTTGPLGLRVATDLGLGLLMPEGSGTEAVRWARQTLPPISSLTVYAWLSVEDDQDAAEAAMLPVVREWRDRDLYPRLYRLAGVRGAAEIGPEMLGDLAVVGSAERCAAQIEALRQAGADSVVFLPVTDEPLEALTRVIHDVVPLLLAGQLGR